MINASCSFPRDRWIPSVVLVAVAAVAWCVGHLPTHRVYWAASSAGPAGSITVASAVAKQAPADLGSLRPTGRINPDGSEVWSYPEGSVLEEVIEVHVKDGRVVREVLRPSGISSADLVAGALSSRKDQQPNGDSSGS